MHSHDGCRVSFGSAEFTQGQWSIEAVPKAAKMERTEKVYVEKSARKALYTPNACSTGPAWEDQPPDFHGEIWWVQ